MELNVGHRDSSPPAESYSPRTPHSVFWSRPDGRLHVQWYRADTLTSFAPHRHPEFNLAVTLEGSVECTQLGSTILCEPGETMIGSSPSVEHASQYAPGPRGCETVSLTFTPDLLPRLSGGRFGALGRHRQWAFLGRLQSRVAVHCARDIVAEMRQRAPGYEVVIEGLALRILVECLRAWPVSHVEQVEDDGRPRLSRRDHIRASEFMRWCRKDEFRLQHLCRYLGTSEERFTRLFRASTGDSPASFYNRLLLQHAAELLAREAGAVKEVSYALGFKTPSHFVVAFRRQFACTPQEFRQRHAGAPESHWMGSDRPR